MLLQVKKGIPSTRTPVTDETIARITKIRLFCDERDARLFALHRTLLQQVKKNDNNEVALLWDYVTDETVIIKGSANRVRLKDSVDAIRLLETSHTVVAMHNHPRNGLFSRQDLITFGIRNAITAMTVVCNDGTIYMMRKEPAFDFERLMQLYNDNIGKAPYSGIKAVARKARSVGVTYRCSVKRRLRT